MREAIPSLDFYGVDVKDKLLFEVNSVEEMKQVNLKI